MSELKSNDENLLVNPKVFWINAHTNPPQQGSKVNVLNRDGVQCGAVVWSSESIRYFDGWLPFAKIPEDIKKIQLSRYRSKYAGFNQDSDTGEVPSGSGQDDRGHNQADDQ